MTLNRREFLAYTGRATLAVSAAGGAAALLTACDPIALRPPDANGVRLQPGFRSRIIAITGQEVGDTGYQWHPKPDGGACFPLADGGWSYVSNSESVPGGAGYVRFSPAGAIIDAGRCLEGTIINCAGGATPWGTWLSCEEFNRGRVWECHPTGAQPGVVRPAMGVFFHEAVAADVANRCLYLTEDRPDGALYRFEPTTWGDLSAGALQVMTEVGGVLGWATVPDPAATVTPTRYQVADTKHFNGGEGIAMSGTRVIFTTKGDNRVWAYEPSANTLTVIYDDDVQVNGVLSGVDNVGVAGKGVIYVAEDGGNMQLVLVRSDGDTFPVVEVTGVTGSEIAGPAWAPSGTRVYFSSQSNPGVTYEVSGPWPRFSARGLPAR